MLACFHENKGNKDAMSNKPRAPGDFSGLTNRRLVLKDCNQRRSLHSTGSSSPQHMCCFRSLLTTRSSSPHVFFQELALYQTISFQVLFQELALDRVIFAPCAVKRACSLWGPLHVSLQDSLTHTRHHEQAIRLKSSLALSSQTMH